MPTCESIVRVEFVEEIKKARIKFIVPYLCQTVIRLRYIAVAHHITPTCVGPDVETCDRRN